MDNRLYPICRKIDLRIFAEDIKDNVRQIKELISRKNILQRSDPIAFQEFARLFKNHGRAFGQGSLLDNKAGTKTIYSCLRVRHKNIRQKKQSLLKIFQRVELFVARKWGEDHFIVPLIAWFVGLNREPSAVSNPG